MNVDPSKVRVVIPNWNGQRWLPGCLAALAGQTFQGYGITVVDDGSTDDSVAWLQQHHPAIRVVALDRNRGFAVAANAGIADAKGADFVALLNNDTLPRPDWLERLVRALANADPRVAAVGSRMLRMEDPSRIENDGVVLYEDGLDQKAGYNRAVADGDPGAVLIPCAGAALYRCRFFEEAGGFDERFGSYLEDVDLGLRALRLGWRFLFDLNAEVLHQGHGSGLAHARYVRLITRNRMLLLTQHLPARFIMRRAGRLLCGQCRFLLAQRRPLSSLAGYTAFLPLVPHALRERRRLRRAARITDDEFIGLLQPGSSLPPLGRAIRMWFSKGGSK